MSSGWKIFKSSGNFEYTIQKKFFEKWSLCFIPEQKMYPTEIRNTSSWCWLSFILLRRLAANEDLFLGFKSLFSLIHDCTSCRGQLLLLWSHFLNWSLTLALHSPLHSFSDECLRDWKTCIFLAMLSLIFVDTVLHMTQKRVNQFAEKHVDVVVKNEDISSKT